MQVSVPNRDGPRATVFEHPIEDVAAEDHFSFLAVRIPRSKPMADHRFVSEEGVLDFALVCPQNCSEVSNRLHRGISGSLLPCISMVKPADSGHPYNSRVRRWAKFGCSALWRILDARVYPVRVVVADVVSD